jgi:hypothetical protein
LHKIQKYAKIIKIINLAYFYMSKILWNNPETQNNSPSQQRDYSADVTKYENHYRNDTNAQELIKKKKKNRHSRN